MVKCMTCGNEEYDVCVIIISVLSGREMMTHVYCNHECAQNSNQFKYHDEDEEIILVAEHCTIKK